jgi:hypothetical protein
MGVDLTLIAVRPEQRSCTLYPADRRSAMWRSILELPSEPAPSLARFDVYESTWKNSDPTRSRGAGRTNLVRELTKIPPDRRRMQHFLKGHDDYGKALRTIRCEQLHGLHEQALKNDWRLEDLDWDSFYAEVSPETLLILYWS